MEKEIYKYYLKNGELIIRKGIGQFSDSTGYLIDFVCENVKGKTKSQCNRYTYIRIDADGYYNGSVYLDDYNIPKAIKILLSRLEEISFNYKQSYIESERKIKYLKELLQEEES